MTARKTLLFLALVFAVNWGMIAAYAAAGGKLRGPGGGLILLLYMLVPMLAAITVQKWVYRQPVVGPLGVSFAVNRWWLIAWLLPALIAIGSFGAALLMPGVHFSSDITGLIGNLKGQLTPAQLKATKELLAGVPFGAFVAFQVILGLVAGPTLNAAFAFGEELGWRGLLLAQFASMRFWPASLLIGLIWGVWHAPIILMGYNFPRHPHVGVAMMIALTLTLAPVITYVRLRAKSVIAAAVLHGSLNAFAGLPLLLTRGGSDLAIGGAGLATIIAVVVIDVALYAYDRFIAREPIMNRAVADVL